MVQPRGDPDLAQEPLRPEVRRELGAEHLHGHVPAVLGVLGEIDRRHAARAKLPLDDVATGEGGGEGGERVGHLLPWSGGEGKVRRGGGPVEAAGSRRCTVVPSAT